MVSMANQSGQPKIIKDFVNDAQLANELADKLFKKPEEENQKLPHLLTTFEVHY